MTPTLGVWFYVLPLEEILFTLTYPILMTSLILVLCVRPGGRRPDVR